MTTVSICFILVELPLHKNTFFLYLAKECKEDENGLKYEGTKSMSSSGGPCLSWKHQLVQRQFNTYNNSMLKENYCRNPDGHRSLWCFTHQKGYSWFKWTCPVQGKREPCDVPFCVQGKNPNLFCY